MNENFCLGQLCAIPAASISIHHAGVTALQFKVNRCTMGTNAFCDIGNAVTSKPAFFNYLAVSQCQMSSTQSLSDLLSSIFAQKNNAKETMSISFAFSLIFQHFFISIDKQQPLCGFSFSFYSNASKNG